MNLNSLPILEQMNNHKDHDQQHNQQQLPFALIATHNQLVSSSSSSSSSQLFFTTPPHHQLYNQPHFQDHMDENYAYHRGGSSYEIKNSNSNNNNNNNNNGLKITLWKKEPDEGAAADINPVKWMSSKIRLMKRMNKNIPAKSKIDSDQNPSSNSSLLESSDHLSSGNSSSYNNNNNSNYPIRVCADCNTTKTPLWRSGPKGPKSLCNACGIRQRKARRAMAAAAAAASGAVVAANQPPPVLKIKVQHKEKMGKNNGHSSLLKKRFKTADNNTNAAGSSADSTNNGKKKLGFEEFLINLSNNLSIHRVFPDDEKDAAILLMALSSGLVHG
ncbi:hypothetical protein ABFS82_10G089500 [Erythranthe guttata]